MSRACILLCVLCLASWFGFSLSICPWLEVGLWRWSNPLTWNDLKFPAMGAKVKVTKRVLLDIQPPSISTITISKGSALVWANIDGIFLNVSYILVQGELHVGSDDCRFRKKATINLYGRNNNEHAVDILGRKFIAVTSGGKLEFHGEDKMSWTKLAHTVPAAQDVDCGMLYDHKKTEEGQQTIAGLHIIIWNQDGTKYDFKTFNTNNYDKLPKFVSGLPKNAVLAAAVMKSLGTPTETFLDTLESFGASSIRSVQKDQNYAFIARVDNTTSAKETISTDVILSLFDPSKGLSFRAASREKDVEFQVMSLELATPKITVSQDVSSWNVGDRILVTSTDFDWRQAEEKKIIECEDCLSNQIRLDSPFTYKHYGEVTHNVDERAEVALLTRNILIQGQVDKECYASTAEEQWLCDTFHRDMFGGQTKALQGAVIHVQGVELFQMGQQHLQGSYPLHFHMFNDASGMWFRNNSIHHSFARCITVHGTHYAEVSDNVCYKFFVHGYFLEDSVEQNNTFHRNLGVGAQHGSLIMSDKNNSWCGELSNFCKFLSVFWITHPNNNYTNNVAAGSDGVGFNFVFAKAPLGISKFTSFIVDNVANHSTVHCPIKKFADNSAHSNAHSGFFFDLQISNGEMSGNQFVPENGVLPNQPNYDPRDPPDATGVPVWTEMNRLTLYKNKVQNAWITGGRIRVVQSSLADSPTGFTGGTISSRTGVEVKSSVFVAETNNTGQGSTFIDRNISEKPSHTFNHSYGINPYDTWEGVAFFQGPVLIENCHFSGYRHYYWADEWEKKYGFRPVRPGGALSFKHDNPYPSQPWSQVKGLKFGYCDNVNDGNWVFNGNTSTYSWGDRDGNKAHNFHDVDGSVTGYPGTQVIRDLPFYTGSECRPRKNWGMTVCPYKYVQMLVRGDDGVLSESKKEKSPLVVRRDDVPQYPMILEGIQGNVYLLRTKKSYTVSFNPDLGTVPTVIDIMAYNVEKGDVVRVALCLPKDTTKFSIRSNFPIIKPNSNPPIMASSLSELDNDVTGRMFFWNPQVGLLYMKFVTNETRQNSTEECANGKCIKYSITRVDGGTGPADCSAYSNPPIVANSTTPAIPVQKPCNGPDSADGLGAVPSDVVAADPFTITCPTSSLQETPGSKK